MGTESHDSGTQAHDNRKNHVSSSLGEAISHYKAAAAFAMSRGGEHHLSNQTIFPASAYEQPQISSNHVTSSTVFDASKTAQNHEKSIESPALRDR